MSTPSGDSPGISIEPRVREGGAQGMRMRNNGDRSVLVVALATIAVACTTSMSADTSGPRSTAADGTRGAAPAAAAGAAAGLGGTSWQLVKFQGGDDSILVPDAKSKYTLTFGTDGRVSARIDCNRGTGTWRSSGPNHLEFGPMALTRAMCPPGSLHDRIVRDLSFVRSYVLKDGHLFLALMVDAGIYEFEPAAGP